MLSRGLSDSFTFFFAKVLPAAWSEKLSNGFYYDVLNKEMPTEFFLLLFFILFLVYLASVFYCSREKFTKEKLAVVLFTAIVCRLVMIYGIEIHENDTYRYVWDGKVMMTGVNPYLYPPIFAAKKATLGSIEEEHYMKLSKLRKESPLMYKRIGYKSVATIYPPVAQLFFWLSNKLCYDSLIFMKLIFVLVDICVVIAIVFLLNDKGLNPLMSVVYAWSPLVLKEIANSGHYDSLAILGFVCFLLFMERKKENFSSLALSAGILSKFFPVVMLPYLWIRKKYRLCFCIVLFVCALYLPFLIWNGTGLRVFSGLLVYAEKWAINGSVFELFRSLLACVLLPAKAYILAKLLMALVYILSFIYLLYRYAMKDNWMEFSFWAIALMFLFSPVADPWYYCWVLPLLCFYPRPSFIMLSGLLVLSYLDFLNPGQFYSYKKLEFDSLVVVQYVPFYLLLFWESKLCIKTRKLVLLFQP